MEVFVCMEPKKYEVDLEPFTVCLEVEVFDLPNNETKVYSRLCEGDSFKHLTEKTEIGKWKKIKKEAWQTHLVEFNKIIKIEAQRKYVANKYDDGNRAILIDKLIDPKKGNSEKNIELDYAEEFHPTEEQLVKISVFDETTHKDSYEKEKKIISPTLNKILILMKDNWKKMECVVDGEELVPGDV